MMKNENTERASKWGWMNGLRGSDIVIPERLPYTKTQLFCDLFSLLLIISVGIFLALRWGDIPASIPMHYDIAGEPDSWGVKSTLLWLAGGMLFVFVIIKVCSFFPRTWNLPISVTQENIGVVLLAAKNMLAALNVMVLLLFAYFIYAAAAAKALNMLIFLPLMALIFVPIIAFYIYIERHKTADRA